MNHLCGSLLAGLLAFSLLAPGATQAQILTRAVDVLALQTQGEPQPVQLSGVVVGVSTMFNFFALSDGTGTVGVFRRRGYEMKQGDLVQITGTTSLMSLEGRLCPRVMLETLEVLGTSELPVPRPVTAKTFRADENFDQWVSLEGYVMRWEYQAPDLRLSLVSADGDVEANVTVAETAQLPRQLHGARLRLTGMIVSTPALGRVLFVPDLKQLDVLEQGTEDLFEAPLVLISDVMQKKAQPGKRWRVQGTFVAQTQQRKIILTGDGGAMMNHTLLPPDLAEPEVTRGETGPWPTLKPGDQVEMVGSLVNGWDAESRTYGLAWCSLRVLAHGSRPEPLTVDLKTLRSYQDSDQWVTFEGVVAAWNLQDEVMTYTVLTPQGHAAVQVRNASAVDFPTDLHGARLRFTGLSRSRPLNSFETLLVPDPSFVTVVNAGKSDPFQVPQVSAAYITSERAPPAERVRTRGTVIGRTDSRILHLRGKNGSLSLHLQQPWNRESDASNGLMFADGGPWPALELGDEVEVVGSSLRPVSGPLPPGCDLYESVARVLKHPGVPPPVETTLQSVAEGAHSSDLVQLRGRLLTLQQVPMDRGQWRTSMLIEQDGITLPVTHQGTGRANFSTLKVDDDLLLRGVVLRATDRDPLQVRLLSEGDVKSLGLAASVRARQLWLWGGGGMAVFAVLVAWIASLRRAGRIQQAASVELKKAMDAARESERRWKLLFEQSPLSVQIFHPDGQTKLFNQAWSKLFRLDDAAGYAFNVLKAPDLVASGAVEHIRKAFEGEVVHVPPVPYSVNTDPPDLRWIGGVLYPVKNEAGDIMEIVTIHTDITDMKRAEEAMLAMNQTLEQRVNERTQELKLAQTDLIRALEQERELNELKSRFVTMVSHEFRTPLGIIMSAIELIRHYEDRLPPDQRRELCDDIFSATRLMASLMEQVLVLGRVEAGKLGCRVQPLDLETLVGKLTDESLSATNRKCPVEWSAENSLDGAVADEALLRHIFSNLITNAVKYSPADSVVRITARREGKDAVFQVIDHGIGIPAEDRARLFEAFYRCGNVGEIPGTGLGLLIVKRCVDLHGGSLHVESEVGKGTTFTVRIPMFEEREATD